jgi:hypothetical protein
MHFSLMVHILNFDWSVFYQITVAFFLSSIVTVAQFLPELDFRAALNPSTISADIVLAES